MQQPSSRRRRTGSRTISSAPPSPSSSAIASRRASGPTRAPTASVRSGGPRQRQVALAQIANAVSDQLRRRRDGLAGGSRGRCCRCPGTTPGSRPAGGAAPRRSRGRRRRSGASRSGMASAPSSDVVESPPSSTSTRSMPLTPGRPGRPAGPAGPGRPGGNRAGPEVGPHERAVRDLDRRDRVPGDLRVRHGRGLELCRPDAVPRHLQHGRVAGPPSATESATHEMTSAGDGRRRRSSSMYLPLLSDEASDRSERHMTALLATAEGEPTRR